MILLQYLVIMSVYNIAIVDDSYQIISALKDELEATQQIKVFFTAKNGADFLEQMKSLPNNQYPDLVLMDIDMPVMNGIDTVRNASILYDQLKFIMLTVFDDDDKIFDALKAGADGYLLKEEKPSVILASIIEIMEKEGAPMSPRIARKTMDLLIDNTKTKESPVECLLSSREIEILKGVVNGSDYKQLAGQLFISPNTVRNHISKIYEKLHITSKAQAVNLAIKNNWV